MKKKTISLNIASIMICISIAAGIAFGSFLACTTDLGSVSFQKLCLPQNYTIPILFVKNSIPFLVFFLLGYLPFGIPLIILMLFLFGTGYGNVFSASILQAGTAGFMAAVKSQFTFTVFIAVSCIMTSLFSIMRIIHRFDKSGGAKSHLKREKQRAAVENVIIFIFAMLFSLISAAIESNVFQYCIITPKI
ncbi:MAG: hypothetical protein LKJ25_05930 [Clostridia bacterium]|jgi:hypothetical protein|nr:hypothetical protein [Clostridia bacterium]